MNIIAINKISSKLKVVAALGLAKIVTNENYSRRSLIDRVSAKYKIPDILNPPRRMKYQKNLLNFIKIGDFSPQ